MEQIYFLSHPRTGRIKVGFTVQLNTRLTAIAAPIGEPVMLLGNLPGGRPLEKAIHEHLRPYRISGEWFRDCDAVREFMDKILADGPEKAIGFIGAGTSPGKRKKFSHEKFRVVAKALWPRKTAAHLAAASGMTERAAARWLAGERQPSPEAFKALIDELFSIG